MGSNRRVHTNRIRWTFVRLAIHIDSRRNAVRIDSISCRRFWNGSAGYSAFLFAQGKGRDLWQSRLFLWQLLSQAIVAGASVLIILAVVESRNLRTMRTLDEILVMSLLVSLAIAMGELFFEHLSEDAKLAADLMIRGELRRRFWLGAIGLGLVLPSAILAVGLYTGILTPPAVLAAVCALAGIWIFKSIWIEAG